MRAEDGSELKGPGRARCWGYGLRLEDTPLGPLLYPLALRALQDFWGLIRTLAESGLWKLVHPQADSRNYCSQTTSTDC